MFKTRASGEDRRKTMATHLLLQWYCLQRVTTDDLQFPNVPKTEISGIVAVRWLKD